VRRLIRNIKTREFFQAGTWTLDAAKAEEFPDVASLMKICTLRQLKGVEMVLRFQGAEVQEVVVQLPF
jgi:hypothetical protein